MTNREKEYFENNYRIPSARLSTWDYSDRGYYFVTICTQKQISYFGGFRGEKVVLNSNGRIVESYWKEIPKHFPATKLDEFITMPNHMHGIVVIRENPYRDATMLRLYNAGENRFQNQGKGSLSAIIGAFKSICTREIRKTFPNLTWQARFYDRIVRDEEELNRIREYIRYNPVKHALQRMRKNYRRDAAVLHLHKNSFSIYARL